MASAKTTYRTIHPETNEEVAFTKGGRPIRWITWGDLGKGLVHFGYSSQETYEKAVKAPRSSNPYATRYEATAATVVEDETPAVQAPTAEPVAVEETEERPMRAGLTTIQDSPSPMNHTVKLDVQMIGVIIDGSAAKLSRGAFAAWSGKCTNRGGIVGFYRTKEDAAEAIADLYAETGPEHSKTPENAKQRAAFLALPTVRRDAIAREAADLFYATRTTAAECWTDAMAWDEEEHPGPDPETGEPVYVRTHSAKTRHLPNPDKRGRYTLCGQEWRLASWYRRQGEIQRPDGWMIRDLPDCGGCGKSHAARQARAAA
ncbi:hypothetical protein [Streptomyces sp. A30]|uniref:hypothetical protein n=1 Tax=Streptomyces sp. A30 TaxID=2789273 RepID=UPI00397F0D2B